MKKVSLEAARKLADYMVARWSAEPDRKLSDGWIVENLAGLGFEPALLALHQETGEQRYLDFCLQHRKLSRWDRPIVVGRNGQIAGHAYAYFCSCLAQLRLYRSQPSPALLKPTRRALDFLIDRDGLVITGSCTSNECWHDSQNGTGNLADTCATAYLIRTLDELLRTDDYDSCWCCHSSSLRSAPGAVKPVMVLPPNHRTINVEQWSIEHSLKN